MIKPTKLLSDEHKTILKVVEMLEEECNSLKEKNIDKDFFIKVIDFIRNYADKFHHAKEEDILFKEMCKPNVEMHCNPVEQMLHEHNLGRNFVKNMELSLNKNDKNELVRNAREYIVLIREHIFKEDNILYPMADEALGKTAQESMAKKFAEIGKERKIKYEIRRFKI
ncbi:MAG: hemerythrin domain-containing protein [Nanoarchaeota archaeon]